jgi:hypothetical protein
MNRLNSAAVPPLLLLLLPQAGIVTDLWLWHGALIDVLADMKG